jgi:galactitol-specific phosphotransferase system IIB component
MIKETFERFMQQYGSGFVEMDLKELWFTIQLGNELDILTTIERLSQNYDDPESAEVGLIMVWQGLQK